MSDVGGPVPPSDPPVGMAVGGAQYPAGPPDRWPAWVPPLPGSGGAGGPEDPGPAPGGSPDRRRAGLVAVGAAVVLLLIAGVVALATGDGGGDEEAAASTPSTSGTTEPFGLPEDPALPSIPPGLDPSDPGFDPSDPLGPLVESRPLAEVLPELIEFVEVTRGHRFRTEPVVEALEEADFLERFRAGVEGTEEDVRQAGVAQRALGILEPDDDPVAIQDDLGEQGVLGFYDPESEELVVRGDEVTPYVEIIIVHELTHALDDQYFDLQRAEALAEESDEAGFGFLALTEGSARRVQVAYEEQLGPDDQISAQIEATLDALGGADPTVDQLPIPFAVATQLPYGNGAELVQAILDEGGNPALDAAFGSPPTTSEQVLDPAQYLARDPAFPVPVPAADGPVTTEGTFGAVDLRILEVAARPEEAQTLYEQTGPVSPSVAVDPVEGLAGGSYVAWEQGGQSCIRFTVVGDSEAATAELSTIVRDWESALGADPLQLDGTRLTSTRCA